MHDSQAPEELGDFTSPNDERFQKQLRRIVDAVEATLEEFSRLKPGLECREEQGHGVKVFVADVADSLQDFRERIIAEAKASRAQVLDDIPPPMESKQHAESVLNALAQADLQVALEWQEERQPNLAWGKRYHPGFDRAMKFLDDSQDARDREAIEKEKERAERWFSPSVNFHSGDVISVSFSPDGKTLASGSGDNTIRLWDVSFYFLFWKQGKSTALLNVFAEGVEFFWQVKRDELEFKRDFKPNLYPHNDYNFEYNPKFRPLLNPPTPGQSKFDQILEWARGQLEKSE